MVRMFVPFSLMRLHLVNDRKVSQSFSPQLGNSYLLYTRFWKSPERMTRAFVREMMTMKKRQSVSSLLKMLLGNMGVIQQ